MSRHYTEYFWVRTLYIGSGHYALRTIFWVRTLYFVRTQHRVLLGQDTIQRARTLRTIFWVRTLYFVRTLYRVLLEMCAAVVVSERF